MMLYNDRCIKKWQGFVLSEHNATINEQKRINSAKIEAKEQQEELEIGLVLNHAFRMQLVVNIQINALENGLFANDVVGTIEGFDEELVYLSSGVFISLSEIRNVQLGVRAKWYQ